ncbi:MAG TPA: RDD family protein [Bacillota bacterium]|nr:RDD family protein [Bacillota bacterium]
MSNEQISIKTPEYVSLQFQSANIGSRAVAFIIDTLIIFIIQIILFFLGVFVIGGFETFLLMSESNFVIMAIIIILYFIINYGYYIFFEYYWAGQTPGKRITGIRVIQDSGHNITLLASFIRNLMRLVDTLPIGYFLGIITIFFHSKNKRIGDIVSGTIVVHERPGKRRDSRFERLIRNRNLPLTHLTIEDGMMRNIKDKEWDILKLYRERFIHLSRKNRKQMTNQVAEIIFPKFQIDITGKTPEEKEDILLTIYLKMQKEWDFE